MDIKIPRMRTAAGAVAFLREADPGNAISVHYVRSLIRSGAIPHINCGVKKLVNVDLLLDFLKGEETA